MARVIWRCLRCNRAFHWLLLFFPPPTCLPTWHLQRWTGRGLEGAQLVTTPSFNTWFCWSRATVQWVSSYFPLQLGHQTFGLFAASDLHFSRFKVFCSFFSVDFVLRAYMILNNLQVWSRLWSANDAKTDFYKCHNCRAERALNEARSLRSSDVLTGYFWPPIRFQFWESVDTQILDTFVRHLINRSKFYPYFILLTYFCNT